MYNKAGLLTRLSQRCEMVGEDKVRCVILAGEVINLLLRLCGWLRARLIRLSGLLLR
jgi:hypothetical protein